MENNNPNHHYQEEGISLREVIITLINSKIIIIVITIICTLISASYVYSKKPLYESKARLMVGTYKTSDNHGRLSDQIIRQVQSIDDIRNEISFHFDKSISNTGDKYFSIRTIESSAELSNKKIKEVVDYSISLSKDIIDIKINQDQRTLKQIKSKIDAIESEFSRLLTLQNVPNTDSRKDVFITELFVELNQLKFDENTLEKKLNDSDLFEYTKLYQEITTNPVISTKTPTIILGSITGFILSIIFIFIRRAFFMK